jgi:hypothetical protein
MTSRLRLLAEICTTVLGLVLAAAPLALWVAPTKSVFLIVILVTVSAIVSLCLIDICQGEKIPLSRLLRSKSTHGLTESFVVELHKHFPLTCHHRRLGDPVFRRKIDRLKKYLST